MKNKSIEVCIHVLGTSEQAIFTCEDIEKKHIKIVIPKSQVELISVGSYSDISYGDAVDIKLPRWLAIDKGLV